jgi:hypothetical protein
MSALPKVRELTMTCSACPTQWEGFLEDGRPLYVRYRWGCLTVQAGGENGADGEYLYDEPIGDPYHGEMPEEEMRRLLANVLEF